MTLDTTREKSEASQAAEKSASSTGSFETLRSCGCETNSRFSFWKNLTYTTRVTAAFALIAAMTAIVAIGVLSFVWDQHFRAYTQENMMSLAQTTAKNIAEEYEKTGTFDSSEIYNIASYAARLSKGAGVRVVENQNAINRVIYDSTLVDVSKNGLGDSAPGVGVKSLAPPETSIARVPIEVDGRAVGSVSVWILGSEALLTSADEEFRNNSYSAMAFATILAILLASCIGFLFARTLVGPVNCMTKTARAIKEGNLSARTHLHGEDEIARLGETFDEMADSIERDRKLERRLTTDVAHELRTPLMAIQCTVEGLIDKVFVGDEVDRKLETINSEVDRLGRLVNANLSLARLENRSKPLSLEEVDVGYFIKDIIEAHEMFVSEAGLTLHYDAEDHVMVRGNPDLLRQAAANLISNAVRYTPAGGDVYVRVFRDENSAAIQVRDTGIGLSPDEAKMVFSRFWRADPGRNRESGGLGIGLSVVKEIVEQHDGWVQVEGEKGKGASFTIHVPLYAEEEVQPKLLGRKPRTEGGTKPKNVAK